MTAKERKARDKREEKAKLRLQQLTSYLVTDGIGFEVYSAEVAKVLAKVGWDPCRSK